jgi:hypothetical protein
LLCASLLVHKLITISLNTLPTALQAEVTIGSGDSCSLRVSGSNVAAEHARIFPKGGRIFCRALQGDPDDLTAETGTWILPDTQLRPGVDYMLSPGAQVCGRKKRKKKKALHREACMDE